MNVHILSAEPGTLPVRGARSEHAKLHVSAYREPFAAAQCGWPPQLCLLSERQQRYYAGGVRPCSLPCANPWRPYQDQGRAFHCPTEWLQPTSVGLMLGTRPRAGTQPDTAGELILSGSRAPRHYYTMTLIAHWFWLLGACSCDLALHPMSPQKTLLTVNAQITRTSRTHFLTFSHSSHRCR